MANPLKDYWDLRYKHSVDLSKSGLLGVGRSFNEWMYKVKSHVFRKSAKKCLRHLPTPISERRIFDVGSGSGFYINEWLKFDNINITGSDISDNSITHLRETFRGIMFHDTDISSFILSSDWWNFRFDIISCMDVLFHIKDDSKYLGALINMQKMLDFKGRIIFTENFVKDRIDVSPHITHRSEDEIYHLFDEANLKIIERKPMLYLMNYPIDRNIDSRLMRFWNKVSCIASVSESWSYIIGMLLYLPELICVNLLSDSPTVEIAIAETRS